MNGPFVTADPQKAQDVWLLHCRQAYRRPEGAPTHLLLIGKGGASITAQILAFVAEPVEISGTIQRHEGQLAFLIDPDSIRRLQR